MTLMKLKEHCDRNPGFTAEVDGDAMTAAIYDSNNSLVMTVKLK